jgi:2-methylaconitate cis-trans-isomerase PrpF
MAHVPQIKIPATYFRGGTSKGVFFRLQDLPASAQVPGAATVLALPSCPWDLCLLHSMQASNFGDCDAGERFSLGWPV